MAAIIGKSLDKELSGALSPATSGSSRKAPVRRMIIYDIQSHAVEMASEQFP